MKKSGGVIRQTLSMMDYHWTDDNIIVKLRQDFSSLSTMNRARQELRSLVQPANQPISMYVYKYGQMHYLTTGIRAHHENHPFAIQEFIASLDTNLRRMIAKKYAEQRQRPQTLQAAFTLAEEMEAKMLEAESFECNSSYRFPSSINELTNAGNAEMNKISHGKWSNQQNSSASGGYKGGYQKKDQKPWHNKDKKPWNDDSKPWHNKDKKP